MVDLKDVKMVYPGSRTEVLRDIDLHIDDGEFVLRVTRGRALLMVDGLTVADLPENTEIKVKKAPFTADFPKRVGVDFFERVSNKLSE